MRIPIVDPMMPLAYEPGLTLQRSTPTRTDVSVSDFDKLQRTSEETMHELRIMTLALRDEIDRRKAVEEELRCAMDRLAMVTATPAVFPEAAGEYEEELVVDTPPEPAWLDLSTTSSAALLRELADERRTGTLLVVSEASEKDIFFEDGRLFSCASNDPRKFLAERLITRGTITEAQRRMAVEIKQASQLALGRILLILGAIDETQLVEAMRAKLEDEIAELLTWTEGRAVFIEGDVPSLQLVPLRIEVEELLAPR